MNFLRHSWYSGITGIAVSLVFALAGAGEAHAQEAAGIQVAPAIIEEPVDPGEEYTFSITVTNVSSAENEVSVITRNITGLSPAGLPIFAPVGEETPYELSSWVTLPRETLTLAPGASEIFEFSITVPEDASPGSHFGGVFFSVGGLPQEETGSAVGYQIGTIVSLRLSGDIVEEAAIRSFTTDSFLYSEPSVAFTARVENDGNVLVRPRGIIEIADMRGTEVAVLSINETGRAVFPSSERDFSASWESDSFGAGRYQAMLSLVYGEEGRKTLTSTVSFWIVPWKVLSGFLGGLLVLILSIFLLIRLIIRKKMREMEHLSKSRLGNAAGGASPAHISGGPSKLLIVTVALLIFSLIFLGILFVLFA